MALTKSELIERVAAKQTQLSTKDVELAVKTMLEEMSQALATGGRIEIRGFGSFSLHYRAPRVGRNPKTGDAVKLNGKYVPHFKPGKELRERVNDSMGRQSGNGGDPDASGNGQDRSANDSDDDRTGASSMRRDNAENRPDMGHRIG